MPPVLRMLEYLMGRNRKTGPCMVCGADVLREGRCREHYEAYHRAYEQTRIMPRSLAMKTHIGERDRWLCGFCGYPVDPALKVYESIWAPVVHYIVPRAKGGPNHESNLAIAHSECSRQHPDQVRPVGCKHCGNLWGSANRGHGIRCPRCHGWTQMKLALRLAGEAGYTPPLPRPDVTFA